MTFRNKHIVWQECIRKTTDERRTQNCIIAKTKCAKIENETSKTSLFFASFFLLASGFVKCKLNAD